MNGFIRKRYRVPGSLFRKKFRRKLTKKFRKHLQDYSSSYNEKKTRRRSNLSDLELDDIECYFNERGVEEVPLSPFLSSTQEKCLNCYLKCKVDRWKYPTSPRDKVELEPLPTQFLPYIKTTPLLIPIVIGHGYHTQYVARVCGYRELYKKRMYIQYLKDLEEEMIRMSRIAVKRRVCPKSKCVVIEIPEHS